MKRSALSLCSCDNVWFLSSRGANHTHSGRSNELFRIWQYNGTHTSVKSSGKWKISRTSSGVFPPMIRARAPQVRSTSGLNCRPRAAEANLQSFSVSIRTNFSSNDLRSCKLRKTLLRYIGENIDSKKQNLLVNYKLLQTLFERPGTWWNRQ